MFARRIVIVRGRTETSSIASYKLGHARETKDWVRTSIVIVYVSSTRRTEYILLYLCFEAIPSFC